jgi:CDGSH-type Zn-finger protein
LASKDDRKEDTFRIKITKGGPYVVYGGVPLSEMKIGIDKNGISEKWIEGEKFPESDCYALCRCGGSKTKPFCDGTHAKVNFNGKETALKKGLIGHAKTVDGPTLVMKDIEQLCAFARFCDRAGGVWENIRESDKEESRKIAIQEAADCPSGRLVVSDKKTGNVIEPKFKKSIALVKDPTAKDQGPIWVRGGIPIESSEGGNYEIRNSVTLCRCGKSKNKPFCDAEHVGS